jgi:hypothetical protein
MTTVQRFWSKVDKTSTCWLWTGALFRSGGYGAFRIRTTTIRAHRLAWELMREKIPRGMCVLHRCDVPACVNPDHLFLGTRADNMKDMYNKGRNVNGAGSRNARRRVCIHGHQFETTVRSSRGRTERVCRECAKIRAANHRDRLREARKGSPRQT